MPNLIFFETYLKTTQNLLESIAQLARSGVWEYEVGKIFPTKYTFKKFIWLFLTFEKSLLLPPPPGCIALDFT